MTREINLFDADQGQTAHGRKQRGQIKLEELIEKQQQDEAIKLLNESMAFVVNEINKAT